MESTLFDTNALRPGHALRRFVVGNGLVGLAVLACGCAQPQATSRLADREEFRQAGPIRIQVDQAQMSEARASGGPHRLYEGDRLLLKMPVATRSSAHEQPDAPFDMHCRVEADGTILLPVIGKVAAAGKTLDELETTIRDAYFPRYVVRPPTIVARIEEYNSSKVHVLGAVRDPGTYELPKSEMSLVSALLAAGGIRDSGSASVTVRKSDQAAGEGRTILLPVKGLDVPFEDIVLSDGDTVEVQPRRLEVFSVIGLVKFPDTHPYPPEADYTLMQGLALSGGINTLADPRYVTVYRQKSDGTCIHARFSIRELASSPEGQIPLKPGDVVAVEQTARTHARVILAHILNIGAGVHVGTGYNLGG